MMMVKLPDEDDRPTTSSVIVDSIVGFILLATGVVGAVLHLEKSPSHDRRIIYVFSAVALCGALLIPSVFRMAWPRTKAVFGLFFPRGLPLPGTQGPIAAATVTVATPPKPPPTDAPPPPPSREG